MRSFVVLFAGLLLCPLAAQCADLDAIEADVCSKWDSIKSMTYDMDSSTNMAGQGFSIVSNSTGTAEMKRKSETVWLMHMTSKGNTTQTMAGKETKSDTSTLMVIDGEFMYSLSEGAGQKMATKMKAQDYSKMAGGKNFFKWLRENYDVKVLPDETVDGASCYAIEATPKNKTPGQMPMTYCFSKDNGMVVATEVKGPDGKVMTSSKLKNVKLNPSIADDHFVFTAPPGVTVTDMTNLPAPETRSAPPPEKEAAPAKTETAEKKETADKPEKKDTEDKPEKKDEKKDPPKKKRKIPGF